MGSPHCYSIVLGGKFGVGKSSLFRRLRSDVFSEEGCEAGAERYTHKTTIDGEAVEVYLWDTGGLEQYHNRNSKLLSQLSSHHTGIRCG
eukprot:Em0018g700a